MRVIMVKSHERIIFLHIFSCSFFSALYNMSYMCSLPHTHIHTRALTHKISISEASLLSSSSYWLDRMIAPIFGEYNSIHIKSAHKTSNILVKINLSHIIFYRAFGFLFAIRKTYDFTFSIFHLIFPPFFLALRLSTLYDQKH